MKQLINMILKIPIEILNILKLFAYIKKTLHARQQENGEIDNPALWAVLVLRAVNKNISIREVLALNPIEKLTSQIKTQFEKIGKSWPDCSGDDLLPLAISYLSIMPVNYSELYTRINMLKYILELDNKDSYGLFCLVTIEAAANYKIGGGYSITADQELEEIKSYADTTKTQANDRATQEEFGLHIAEEMRRIAKHTEKYYQQQRRILDMAQASLVEEEKPHLPFACDELARQFVSLYEEIFTLDNFSNLQKIYKIYKYPVEVWIQKELKKSDTVYKKYFSPGISVQLSLKKVWQAFDDAESEICKLIGDNFQLKLALENYQFAMNIMQNSFYAKIQLPLKVKTGLKSKLRLFKNKVPVESKTHEAKVLAPTQLTNVNST